MEKNREHYPRVSDIIGKQTEAEMRKIPIETLAHASLRGVKVHGYCLSYAEGLFLAGIESEYEPYVNEFIFWYDQEVSELVHSSTRLYDDTLKFTGEFDFIAKMHDGSIALIDIKTSSVKSKAWPIQLAAYAHLCELNGYKFQKIINLHLKKQYTKEQDDSDEKSIIVKPIVIEYKDIYSNYWTIFQSALTCYNYFDRKEIK